MEALTLTLVGDAVVWLHKGHPSPKAFSNLEPKWKILEKT